MNILILTSATGGGHLSVAQTLSAGFTLYGENRVKEVYILPLLEEVHPIARLGAELYNLLLREKQHWVKYYHWLVNRSRPDILFTPFCSSTIHNIFLLHQPDIIISVHPMIQHAVSSVLSHYHMNISFFTVVTDPCGNSWRGWASAGVDHYFVPHEEARAELLLNGVPVEKITVSGFPVHPRIVSASQRLTKSSLRKNMGLQSGLFTLFFNAGWAGGGNIYQILMSFLNSSSNLQIIFLAGKNAELLRNVRGALATSKNPSYATGYTTQIEELMMASDLMITKAGASTLYEGLVCGLPMLIDHTTQPMPQERGLANLLENEGAAINLKKCNEVHHIIRHLQENDVLSKMRASTIPLATPQATRCIVEAVLNKKQKYD